MQTVNGTAIHGRSQRLCQALFPDILGTIIGAHPVERQQDNRLIGIQEDDAPRTERVDDFLRRPDMSITERAAEGGRDITLESRDL